LRPDLSILQGHYLQDVIDQPVALKRTLDTLTVSPVLDEFIARVRAKDFSRIVLTGMGSSFHVLHPFNLDLIQLGYNVIMVETSELVHYQRSLFDSKTLIIAVSQSGRSAEILRLLQINQHRTAVVAVTNAEDSLLARQADAVILTSAGKEFSVSCKTYVCALLALKWFANLLANCECEATRKELGQAELAVKLYLDGWQDHVWSMSEILRNIRHMFILGRGRSLAAVGTGALVVKESDHFHAEGMSSAAFRHGPFEMLNRETFVLVLSGDPATAALNRRLVRDIRDQKTLAELVAEDADNTAMRLPVAPRSISPILEILPVQTITMALAVLAGRQPGLFELASKVTTTE
jgi:glucosamine--fructose-6-phosphate aminotransferase (isomerizing)